MKRGDLSASRSIMPRYRSTTCTPLGYSQSPTLRSRTLLKYSVLVRLGGDGPLTPSHITKFNHHHPETGTCPTPSPPPLPNRRSLTLSDQPKTPPFNPLSKNPNESIYDSNVRFVAHALYPTNSYAHEYEGWGTHDLFWQKHSDTDQNKWKRLTLASFSHRLKAHMQMPDICVNRGIDHALVSFGH